MYAPLAPYVVPTTDHYGQVKDRSPLLMHCIMCVPLVPPRPSSSSDPDRRQPLSRSAVASRHSNETALVEFNRNEALRLMRETLYAERPVTLDDVSRRTFPFFRPSREGGVLTLSTSKLKGSLVWGAWLVRPPPPSSLTRRKRSLTRRRLQGKGAPPGHAVTLALQLDLPRVRPPLLLLLLLLSMSRMHRPDARAPAVARAPRRVGSRPGLGRRRL